MVGNNHDASDKFKDGKINNIELYTDSVININRTNENVYTDQSHLGLLEFNEQPLDSVFSSVSQVPAKKKLTIAEKFYDVLKNTD